MAAEMAGEIVAINDHLAGALLSIVADATASDELHSRAALDLGPVLEQLDVGSQIDLSGMGADVSQSTGVENGSVEVN